MNKIEKERCEKLIEEAKENLNLSNTYWEKYQMMIDYQDEDEVGIEIALRQCDRHRGYAEGIYQALVVIGYYSASMEELTKRI